MLTVLKYTIKENVTKKAFIITTVILMAMIVIICNVPNIIKFFEKDGTIIENAKFIIVDEQNLIGEELNALTEIGKEIHLDIEIQKTVSEETIEKIIIL